MDYLITIVQHILHSYKLKGDKMEIRKILHSDPTFPSAISIIRTLSFWGINSGAYKTDYEHLVQGKEGMIVHCKVNGGRFFVIKEITPNEITLYDGKNHLIAAKDFQNIWDGIVLVVESFLPIAQRKSSYSHRTPLLAVIMYFVIAALAYRQNATLLIMGCTGYLLSYFLLLKTTLKHFDLPFCHHGSLIDCETVSNSNPFYQNIKPNLPIIGCFYFLFIALSSFHEGVSMFSACICAFAAIVACYLMLFQFLILKRICIYCWIISILVIAIFGIITMTTSFCTISFWNLKADILNTMVSGTISFLMLNILQSKQESVDKETALLKIKRMPGLFRYLQRDSKKINLSSKNALIFGAERGIYTIDTIIDLDCKYCKSLVQNMQNVLHHYRQFITWRLYIDTDCSKRDNEDIRPLQIIEKYQKYNEQALDVVLERKQIGASEITDETRRKYEKMLDEIRENQIGHYPIILFNGVEIPQPYNISDINILINDWTQSGNPPNK